MIQTWAILKDAYRELNARKMFWISLGISALVIAVIGVFGVKDGTLRVLWIDTGVVLPFIGTPGLFYKFMFTTVGVNLWLSWASVILALVSSASLIPDFVQSGAIECVLSRPISRTRLFLTKYVSGLLFVGLQAVVFVVVAVLIIGVRGGVWLWGIAAAIPMMVLFFSYLYAVSTLVGVWTRSTLASLIASLFIWLVCFGANTAEEMSLYNSIEVANKSALIARDSEMTKKLIQEATTVTERESREAHLAENQKQLEKVETAAFYHRIFYTFKTALPKTSETAALVERAITTQPEFEAMHGLSGDDGPKNGVFSRKTMREGSAVLRARSVWWVIGTSLGFEAVVVAGACWIFARRDF